MQAFYFFKFLDDFGKYKNVQDKIRVFTVDSTLQSMTSDYCGPFQLYFYYNLFEPFENSIAAHKKSSRLDHKLVQEFLNEIFTRNSTFNENMLDGFIFKNNHKLGGEHLSMSEDEAYTNYLRKKKLHGKEKKKKYKVATEGWRSMGRFF